MRTRSVLALVLVLLVSQIVGCAGGKETQSVVDIYTKSVEATQEANSYAFDITATQIMRFPKSIENEDMPESIAIESQGRGKALQRPLAMEMTMVMSMQMPGIPGAEALGNIEMTTYLVDNCVYTFNPMLGVWIHMDMGELGDLGQMSGMGRFNDPMQLLQIIGEDGAAKASLTTEGNYHVITIRDENGNMMQRLFDDIIQNELAESFTGMGLPMEHMLNNLKITNVYYEIWVEKESYYPTRIQFDYSVSMSIENVTLITECATQMTMTDFGAFDTITIPDEVKESSISMEDLLAGPDF